MLGHEVSKSEVLMGDGPIRNTGEFAVVLSLHADIETSIQVVVSPE
ncbi:MAG TPA: 50S ribosomal L9 C-terminal domain-containing protein [Xanthomonadales bacterium]|nr:50S ribosomal L9 C-terminal domain-containing protein [Xanthomonadales bacterium]